MQTFQVSNGPPAAAPQKFVFVNEHSRHKRVKVVRACEGCRRRKIRCDSATTNTWPCAACKRLKLLCVPPAGGVDYEQNDTDDSSTAQEPAQSSSQPLPTQYDLFQNFSDSSVYNIHNIAPHDVQTSHSNYLSDDFSYLPQHSNQPTPNANTTFIQSPYTPMNHSDINDISEHSTPQSPDNQTAESLSEQLGSLKIDANGVAQYLRDPQSTSNEPEGPIQESEYELPLTTIAGGQIRIPPELMPDDRAAKELFRTYFEHVHPYVPVLCRSQFYQQWKTDRQNISPLLLEAIFACADRISGGPVEESPWLALANKHEASFLGAPKLSTVQALLILMKAREAFPKRGYFYKSWITIKTIVSMAKDLDMHEHRSIHEAGESCGSSSQDCIIKTRIWQLTMGCELMIGATQGRFDFGTDINSIDISPHPINSDIDPYEYDISHQFTFFTRNILNIRICVEAYMKVRRKPDWALDPIFKKLQDDFHQWPVELSSKIRLSLPADGSLPKLPSHFIGNMHGHFQLGIIMLHRPQIMTLAKLSCFNDGQWRHCMSLCYNAAKALCRIQEAIVEQYDMTGLLCMQRGMSFTIYAILTCVMLHMIAITSPDPEFNSEARDYFIRHMRLLEKCTAEWSMAETNRQIYNLRAAFSANLEKPFDLKPSFPYGSPSSTSSTLRRFSEPPSDYMSGSDHTYLQQQPYSPTSQAFFSTAPTSNINGDSKPQSPQYYTDYGFGDQGQSQLQHVGSMDYSQHNLSQNQTWNPQPIIDTFNAAFAIPSQLQPPTTLYGSSPITIVSGLPHQYISSPETPSIDLDAYARHQAQAQAEAQARVLAQAQASQGNSQQQPQLMITRPVGNLQQQTQNPQPNYYGSDLLSSTTYPISSSQSYMPEAQYMHDQAPIAPQPGSSAQVQMPREVYMSPKEWQQTMATVFEQGGLKRRWTYDTQNQA